MVKKIIHNVLLGPLYFLKSQQAKLADSESRLGNYL